MQVTEGDYIALHRDLTGVVHPQNPLLLELVMVVCVGAILAPLVVVVMKSSVALVVNDHQDGGVS